MEQILANSESDYYCNLRVFNNGAFEVISRPVRPMQQAQAKRRFESFGCSVRSAISEDQELSEESRAEKDAANKFRACRRAKQKIRFLIKQMAGDRLLTLTYRDNMTDRELLKAHFKDFVRRVRKAIPGWQYVAVMEKQGRGAYHIHCAVSGFQKIKILRRCWYQALGGSGAETGDQTPGQIDVTSPRNKLGIPTAREWKSDKLAGYLTKYLEKTFTESDTEKRRYWQSADIHQPEKERIWLGSTNVVDVIRETVSLIQSRFSCGVDFDMWISKDQTSFWIAGRGD